MPNLCPANVASGLPVTRPETFVRTYGVIRARSSAARSGFRCNGMSINPSVEISDRMLRDPHLSVMIGKASSVTLTAYPLDPV